MQVPALSPRTRPTPTQREPPPPIARVAWLLLSASIPGARARPKRAATRLEVYHDVAASVGKGRGSRQGNPRPFAGGSPSADRGYDPSLTRKELLKWTTNP